jgi:hypothetical protein
MLKGCHARGMISTPYLFWSAKLVYFEPLTYFEPPTGGEPVIAIKHVFFACFGMRHPKDGCLTLSNDILICDV